jgi:hypothetical protein
MEGKNHVIKGMSRGMKEIRVQRGLAFGLILLTALVAFEIFNFGTTQFALVDLMGELYFLGISWATILAIAFCGIDFAGIARLFTPEGNQEEGGEIWYLFGAWLLAATMNAMLTWWGISAAIIANPALGSAVVDREVLLRYVPVFVAVLVWLSRVLIIGTFSVAGNRIFTQRNPQQNTRRKPAARKPVQPLPVQARSQTTHNIQADPKQTQVAFRPVPNPSQYTDDDPPAIEPTYHPVTAAAREQSAVYSH